MAYMHANGKGHSQCVCDIMKMMQCDVNMKINRKKINEKIPPGLVPTWGSRSGSVERAVAWSWEVASYSEDGEGISHLK